MANALQEAPSKEKTVVASPKTKEEIALSQEFDINKKYMFELAAKNLPRELPVLGVQNGRSTPLPHKEFNPYRNIVYSSQVVWNGKRRIVRYYDGCDSIFADEQPKEKEALDQYIKQTKRRAFLEGRFGAFGDERMLLLYMMICSWNAESEFRTRTADVVFVPSNKDKQVTQESEKLDMQEEASSLAKNATETKMLIHANYLGVATMDYHSGNDLTSKEIRIEYRKKALEDSKNFIESYGNKAIELKYYIDKALLAGTIHNKLNPNKASWKNSNSEICDISGLRSNEAISDRLFEYSQTEEGQEFGIQLRALYNN